MYRLGTGELPFQGKDAMNTLLSVATQQPVPPRDLNPELPEAFATLVLQLLAKDAGDRPASAEAVVEALQALEAGLALRPGQETGAQRARLGARLFRVVALAVLLGVGVWLTVVIVRDQQGKEVARFAVPPQGTVEVRDGQPAPASTKHLPDMPPAAGEPRRDETLPTQGPIDLLALVEPARDAVRGTWRLAKGVLESPEEGLARIQIRYLPPPEYRLELTAERTGRPEALEIGLKTGARQFVVCLDGFGGGRSGLYFLDNRQYFENETAHKGQLFADGRPHTILCEVRKDGVTVQCDARPVIHWQGAAERLTLTPQAGIPDERLLFLGGWARYRIH
jgi:hypothetical protein